TSSPRLSGVLLRAKIPRKCPVGTSMTRPVRTRATCRGLIVTSYAAARSNPAASVVPYVGRGTVESNRVIFSRIRRAYREGALAAVALLVVAAAAAAQDLSGPLALDQSIKTGTLPNGLTYFIRPNRRPANRANLRLVVKAGSIDEGDHQRGVRATP